MGRRLGQVLAAFGPAKRRQSPEIARPLPGSVVSRRLFRRPNGPTLCRSVSRLIRDGDLPTVRVGERMRIRPEANRGRPPVVLRNKVTRAAEDVGNLEDEPVVCRCSRELRFALFALGRVLRFGRGDGAVERRRPLVLQNAVVDEELGCVPDGRMDGSPSPACPTRNRRAGRREQSRKSRPSRLLLLPS